MLTSVVNELDTQKPAITTRAAWYLKLFLVVSVPMIEFIRVGMKTNNNVFEWWMVLDGWPATVTAALAFMSRSVPEDTKGQIQKKVEAAQLIATAPTGVTGELNGSNSSIEGDNETGTNRRIE